MDKLIVVSDTGVVKTLYSDDLPDLGAQKITRASNVEADSNGKWFVKLTNAAQNGLCRGQYLDGLGGVTLVFAAAARFERRIDALCAEAEFIQNNLLRGPCHG